MILQGWQSELTCKVWAQTYNLKQNNKLTLASQPTFRMERARQKNKLADMKQIILALLQLLCKGGQAQLPLHTMDGKFQRISNANLNTQLSS